MKFSVWQAGPRRYDYYEGMGSDPHSTPQPALPKGELGVASTEVSPWLPAGAVKTGEGKQARGIIARARGVDALGDLSPATTMVGLLFAAWATWKYLLPGRRGR